jgi:hypothetical protein
MGWRGREKEFKGEILGSYTVHAAARLVAAVLHDHVTHTLVGSKTDFYWKPLKGMNADFIRLRKMSDNKGMLTVKHSDKGDNFDRVELDLLVDFKQAKRWMEQVMGAPAGSIKKLYHILFMGDDERAAVVYKVDKYPVLFLEVEDTSGKKVMATVKKLGDAGIKVKRIKKSLYRLIVVDGKKNKR